MKYQMKNMADHYAVTFHIAVVLQFRVAFHLLVKLVSCLHSRDKVRNLRGRAVCTASSTFAIITCIGLLCNSQLHNSEM